MADLTSFPPLIIYLDVTSFDWNHVKRIKTNARGNWELYLEHVNKRNSIGIRVRVRTNVKFLHSTRIRVRVGIRVRIRQCKYAIIDVYKSLFIAWHHLLHWDAINVRLWLTELSLILSWLFNSAAERKSCMRWCCILQKQSILASVKKLKILSKDMRFWLELLTYIFYGLYLHLVFLHLPVMHCPNDVIIFQTFSMFLQRQW